MAIHRSMFKKREDIVHQHFYYFSSGRPLGEAKRAREGYFVHYLSILLPKTTTGTWASSSFLRMLASASYDSSNLSRLEASTRNTITSAGANISCDQLRALEQ